jgi:uncharacterized iron-regulated membrane protein
MHSVILLVLTGSATITTAISGCWLCRRRRRRRHIQPKRCEQLLASVGCFWGI